MSGRLLSGLWLCLRLLPRRLLRLIGMGSGPKEEAPLLPTTAAAGSADQPPSVWRGVPDPATAAKQEEAAAWDDWTNAAKEELDQKETKEDRQAKKIDNLFSEMAPKAPTKLLKKKGSPRVPMQAMAAPTSRGGRVEAGSRLSMGAANFDLGDLSDDEEDAWGGDDLDMSSIKQVERDAIRKAREARRAQKPAAEKPRDKLKGRALNVLK